MKKKLVYLVWYGKTLEKEAFFTEKEAAQAFASLVNGHMNAYKWEIKPLRKKLTYRLHGEKG